MYLGAVRVQMKSQDVLLKVQRNIAGMMDWAQWAIFEDGKHIREGDSLHSKQDMIAELEQLIVAAKEQDALSLDQEHDLFNLFEHQTKCHRSNINDIAEWLNLFVKAECNEELELKGILELRTKWNQGLLLQYLATAINPVLHNDVDQMPSVASYYKAIIWSLDVPDIIQFRDCDNMSHNSEPDVLAFLSLVKSQMKE